MFDWVYFWLGFISGILVIILSKLVRRRHAKITLKAVDELTAEEVTGMRVEAAKQSLSRLLETEDFKKLLLHEKIYVIIHQWPLSGSNGNFNIGSKTSIEMAELIKKVIEK